MSNNATREATFFVQIQRHQFRTRNGRYANASAVKMTQQRPVQLEADSVCIALTVRVPALAFEPLSPSATIDIPAELIQSAIEVEAVDSS